MKFVVNIALVLLLLVPVIALATPRPLTEEEVAAQKAAWEAGREQREKAQAVREDYLVRFRGWVMLGLNDELVGTGDLEQGWWVVQDGDGLILLEMTWVDGAMPVIKGCVDSEGAITLMDSVDGGERVLPYRWSARGESGALRSLEAREVLCQPFKKRPRLPWRAKAWFFIAKDGSLVPGAEKTRPFPNCIWLQQKKGRLIFHHLGPDHKGVYAEVHSDCSITYHNLPYKNAAYAYEDIPWKITDEERRPAYYHHGILKPNLFIPYGAILFKDGVIAVEAPPPGA